MLQAKTLITLKSKDFTTCGFQKNSRHTHQNPLKSSPVSGRSPYPLQMYVCFSPLTSGLESFGHKSKSTSSDRPWIELVWKWVGPRKVNFPEYLD